MGRPTGTESADGGPTETSGEQSVIVVVIIVIIILGNRTGTSPSTSCNQRPKGVARRTDLKHPTCIKPREQEECKHAYSTITTHRRTDMVNSRHTDAPTHRSAPAAGLKVCLGPRRPPPSLQHTTRATRRATRKKGEERKKKRTATDDK